MNFKNTEVWGFGHALRGMRNPMNSWDKSDSSWDFVEDESVINPNDEVKFVIGKNDMKLAQQLIRAGSEHRKFMRQIFVSVDITAPLYWWKEFDTYKVGTVSNSTSTMHKLATTPITIDCFETDDFDSNIDQENFYKKCDKSGESINLSSMEGKFCEILYCSSTVIINICEKLRQKFLETGDKRYWKELIRWLPESWLQKRTVTMSYENLLAMCSKGQRRFHKLNEWSGQDNPDLPNFISWARTLPYAQELIFCDELIDRDGSTTASSYAKECGGNCTECAITDDGNVMT